MKKIFATICAFALVLCTGLGLSACAKDNKIDGHYEIRAIEIMGLTASTKDFEVYSKSRSDNDIKNNTLYDPVLALMNMELTLDKLGNGQLVFKDYENIMKNNNRFGQFNEVLQDLFDENGNLVINNICYVSDMSQKNAYYIYPTDENGNKMSFTDLLAGSPYVVDHIHATIKNGKLACRVKVMVVEPEGEPSMVYFSTNATVQMKKK